MPVNLKLKVGILSLVYAVSFACSDGGGNRGVSEKSGISSGQDTLDSADSAMLAEIADAATADLIDAGLEESVARSAVEEGRATALESSKDESVNDTLALAASTEAKRSLRDGFLEGAFRVLKNKENKLSSKKVGEYFGVVTGSILKQNSSKNSSGVIVANKMAVKSITEIQKAVEAGVPNSTAQDYVSEFAKASLKSIGKNVELADIVGIRFIGGMMKAGVQNFEPELLEPSLKDLVGQASDSILASEADSEAMAREFEYLTEKVLVELSKSGLSSEDEAALASELIQGMLAKVDEGNTTINVTDSVVDETENALVNGIARGMLDGLSSFPIEQNPDFLAKVNNDIFGVDGVPSIEGYEPRPAEPDITGKKSLRPLAEKVFQELGTSELDEDSGDQVDAWVEALLAELDELDTSNNLRVQSIEEAAGSIWTQQVLGSDLFERLGKTEALAASTRLSVGWMTGIALRAVQGEGAEREKWKSIAQVVYQSVDEVIGQIQEQLPTGSIEPLMAELSDLVDVIEDLD